MLFDLVVTQRTIVSSNANYSIADFHSWTQRTNTTFISRSSSAIWDLLLSWQSPSSDILESVLGIASWAGAGFGALQGHLLRKIILPTPMNQNLTFVDRRCSECPARTTWSLWFHTSHLASLSPIELLWKHYRFKTTCRRWNVNWNLFWIRLKVREF